MIFEVSYDFFRSLYAPSPTCVQRTCCQSISSQATGLSRQFSSSLLRCDVRRVPIGPVLITHTGSFLALSVRGFRTTQRADEIGYGTERSYTRVNPARKPRCNLLQHPTITVGITEHCERTIGAAFRINSSNRAVRRDDEALSDVETSLSQRISHDFN